MNKVIIIHYEEDSEAIETFKNWVRCVWDDHVTYTRDANISIMASLPDTPAIVDRLMKNQEEIGSIIEPYYGKVAADKLTALLKEHVRLVGECITAIRDAANTDAVEASLLANAGLIADHLESLDPVCWPKTTVLPILAEHITCTKLQATSRFAKDWITDIAAFDSCRSKIYTLADAMSSGIVSQFPEMFIVQSPPVWMKTAVK
jgi:hypothetical protein